MKQEDIKKDSQEGLNLIEVLENLDKVLVHLLQKITIIEGKINSIEYNLKNNNNPPVPSDILNIPKLNSVGNPSNVTLKASKPELTKFNRDALTKLYHSVEDEWSKNMIDTILRGKYNTLTEKQLSKINEIADTVGFTDSITVV